MTSWRAGLLVAVINHEGGALILVDTKNQEAGAGLGTSLGGQ